MRSGFTKETIILIAIYLILASFTVYNGFMFSKTLPWVQIHNIISSIVVGIIFFGNVFILYPRYYHISKKTYWYIAILCLSICFLLETWAHAHKASALIKDQRGSYVDPYDLLFQPFNLEEAVPLVLGTFLFSLLYLYFRSIIGKSKSV